MRKRREAKRDAVAAAKDLLELAISSARTDPSLAKDQAAMARRIMLKFNIRFDWSLRRFYCHGCKLLIIPGVNARARLGHDHVLRLTCAECGHVNRKPLMNEARLNIEREGQRKLLG